MALRDQPYLPLFVKDFLTDEKLMECSASATGIYIRIMCIMHKSEEYGTILLKQKDKQTDNQIKNFALKLAKHLPYTIDEIISGLTELITEGVLQNGEDKLSQKRMVKDNRISIIRSDAGKRGGLQTQLAKANSEANSEANSANENEDIKKGMQGETNHYINPKQFEEFWNIYPKKVDKGKALTAWNKLCRKNLVTLREIKLAIHNQKKSERWQDKTYIPHPATWINQSRWLDDPKEMKNINRDDDVIGATYHQDIKYLKHRDGKETHSVSGEIY